MGYRWIPGNVRRAVVRFRGPMRLRRPTVVAEKELVTRPFIETDWWPRLKLDSSNQLYPALLAHKPTIYSGFMEMEGECRVIPPSSLFRQPALEVLATARQFVSHTNVYPPEATATRELQPRRFPSRHRVFVPVHLDRDPDAAQKILDYLLQKKEA